MAILDLTNAKQAVNMTDPGLVTFGSFVASSPTQWNWFTPGQHQVNSFGANLTFDGAGHATGGTINEIGIDLGGNDFNDPDVTITGISVAAARLDDGPVQFWDVLSGDDTIIGPSAATIGRNTPSIIFGDGFTARAGASASGHDVFELGDSRLSAYGDVYTVEARSAGPSAPVFTGGNDRMSGQATAEIQSMTGDVWSVDGPAKLIGGNDNITTRSSAFASRAVGDAVNMQGTIDGLAEIIGGDDAIFAALDSVAELVGDVANQGTYSRLTGGDDVIVGGDQKEILIGDVHNGGGTLIGGADEIHGLGGADTIVGDVFNQSGDVTGGTDNLHGGAGNDRIFGEYVNRVSGSLLGGNDQLYGDEGDDSLFGQTGDDILNGGTGADQMFGGKDNDKYVVDSAFDTVTELAGEGLDRIFTYLDSYTLGDNVESLQYIGTGNFQAKGNSLSNRIDSGSGNDTFILDGSGNDEFFGNSGFDTIDYRMLGGAAINLTTNVNSGSAAGDFFGGIERIFGSLTGADVLTAGPGSNELAPGERVVFFGYGGNDILTGGSGADSLYGGTGNDRIDGGSGNDAFLGGEDGNDAIFGGLGNDTLDGAAGNDRLDGGLGGDNLAGGLGNDSYHVQTSADVVNEAAGAGFDTIFAMTSYTMAANAERLYLSGTANYNANGRNGQNDFLAGNSGDNIINGFSGNDTIRGGLGNDTLTGGAGLDIFQFLTAPNTAANHDTITDFSTADDVIQMDNAVYTLLGANGALAANLFKNLSAAQDADDRILYDQANGNLYYDTNGLTAGGVIHFAEVTNGLAPTAADFVVV